MSEPIQRPRGTEDVLPPRSSVFRKIENAFIEAFETHGFSEIRVPVFERAELFQRGIGEDTDIVSKEMYVFEDRGGRMMSLRPEGTAGVVRAFLENGLAGQGTVYRFFYVGPMFRYERPQAGRLRQHTQIGAEILGDPEPSADAELIGMLVGIFGRLGLADLTVLINNVGCPECRPAYHQSLVAFLAGIADRLCPDCLDRKDRNPLRVFDCKNEGCQEVLENAPRVSDALCDRCREHSAKIEEFLRIAGVNYRMDSKLVRGLDYYTRTVFEIKSASLGAQDTVCAGGRYDNLVEQIGGPSVPALGFACGVERLQLALEARGALPEVDVGFDLYLAHLGDAGFRKMFSLAAGLRRRGIRVALLHTAKGFKAHFKNADRMGARHVLVCGENEIQHGVYAVKRMSDGKQLDVSAEQVEKWSTPADVEGVFQ
jgi:histidyl-tRNA synthetase